MALSKEAEDTKPKKPLNAYFKFRGEKLTDLKDETEKMDKIKVLWGELDPNVKEEMDNEYKTALEKFKKDMEAWKKKYNVTDGDVKRKSKKKRD
jgi:hypothetical protein